jgi:integrase/recombinase XerD
MFELWLVSFNKRRLKMNKNTDNIVISNITFNQFGNYADEFLQSLADQGYVAATIRQYHGCIDVIAYLMHAGGIDLRELDEALAVSLAEKANRKSRKIYDIFIARRFVRFLNDHGAGKPPAPLTASQSARTELRVDYEQYLRKQRGLSEATIIRNRSVVDRFLNFRFGEGLGDLSKTTPDNIAAFLQHLTKGKRPLRDKSLSTHLRSFFRYLFKAGKTPVNLALSVPRVRQQYGTRLPRHLSPEQVESLLGAIRCGSSCDRRNYAMVLMMARLGLRAPEVIAMQIDDIDWRASEIIVRGKGKLHDRVPLPQDVGEALADYIRHDRETVASRALFVTSYAPYRPLKDGQILNNLIRV